MDADIFAKTMSVPSAPQQSSIRSFFQPRPAPSNTPPASIQTTANPLVSSPSAQISVSLLPVNNKPAASLPKQASISHIDPSHIQPLRRINSLLLAVNYPDSFYHKILDLSTGPSFSRTILWQDSPSSPPKVVGGIVCRLDSSLAPDSTPTAPKYSERYSDIYVQSLALLSPYRRYGLATAALKSVIDAATEETRFTIVGLYAHVWTRNTEGLEWYAARGFQKEEPILHGYYKRLNPDSAWILRRQLSVGDHLSHPNIAPTAESIPPATTEPAPQPTQKTRPQGMAHAASFQDRRPASEWNDLPEDVLGGSLKPPSASASMEGSAASSRSSSRSAPKKKKERLYPAAAFGS